MGYSPWDHKKSDTTEQLTQYITKKMHNVRIVSLSFIGDKVKTTAQEIAPQIALKGCSKEAGRKLSTRMTLVKQEHSTCNQTHISYERSLLAMRNRPQIGGPSRFSRYEEMKESGSQNLLNYLTILKTCSACFPQSTEHPIPDLHAELPSGDVEGHLLQQLMI